MSFVEPHVFELEAHGGADQWISVGYRAHLRGGFVPALQAPQSLALEQAAGREQVGAFDGAHELLGERQGAVELTVADKGLTEQQADLGLRLTAGLTRERLQD